MNIVVVRRDTRTSLQEDLQFGSHCKTLKVQCKEVKNMTSLLSVIMLLIKRHVLAYSEAIIRFNKC